MIKKNFLFGVLIVTSFLLGSWGTIGHQTVAKIAESHLTPKARQAIFELLGNESLADVSTWADEVRPTPEFKYTAPWHYLNVTSNLSFDEFSKAVISQQTDNIYSAIIKCKHTLVDKASTREQKIEALKFIVHFVGDAHQPMHVSRSEDKGGNTIQVQFNGQGTNLHALWDNKLIDRQGLSLEEMTKKYSQINDNKIIEWQGDDVMKWLFESYQISHILYTEIEKENKLGEDYYNAHIAIVEQRIAQGGIRLAGLLNEVFKYGLTTSIQNGAIEKAIVTGEPAEKQEFPIIKTDEVMQNIGKSVTIIDVVADYKTINPNLTLLNIGSKYPNQKLTIAIKGSDVRLNPADIKNKKIRVSGIIELFKDRPEIIVTSPANINVDKS